jgi:hypothetical protein
MAQRSLPWFFLAFVQTDVASFLERDRRLLRPLGEDLGGADADPPSPLVLDQVTRDLAQETGSEPVLREAFALLAGRRSAQDRFPENLALFIHERAAYSYVQRRYRLPTVGFVFPLLYLSERVRTGAPAEAWRRLAQAVSLGDTTPPEALLASAAAAQWRLLETTHRQLGALVEAIADRGELPGIRVLLQETLMFVRIDGTVRPHRILTLGVPTIPFFDLAQCLLRYGERRGLRRCPGCRTVFLPASARQRACPSCRR